MKRWCGEHFFSFCFWYSHLRCLHGLTDFVVGMAPNRKKSPARSWQQKSPDGNARSAAGSREETMKSNSRSWAHRSTLHQVDSEQDECSRNSVSECGDGPRVSHRILLNAIKNMGEKLENIIDILTPRSLKTGWSTGINEGDFNVVSDDHEMQVRMMVNFN